MRTQCTHCQAKFKAPDGSEGKKVKCPKCCKPFAITALREGASVQLCASCGKETTKPAEASAFRGVLLCSNCRKKTISEEMSILFTELPKSFHNPHEYDAEYILIPGGSFEYSVTKKTEQVSNVYFARYPVTNKRYRRFIRYLEEKEYELLEILAKDEFDKRMTVFVSGIEDFSECLGRRPNKWPKKLRSKYDTRKYFYGEDQPVVGISWFGARAYCYWLSLLEAAGENLSYDKAPGLYRLPSEIEWEWAAGGGEREYPWASEKGLPSDKLANYCYHVGATTPVGRYPDGATPEGLMDMAGNVMEWMENRYGEKEDDPPFLRGGSWPFDVDDLRCSFRISFIPDGRYEDVGFRVVRSQP